MPGVPLTYRMLSASYYPSPSAPLPGFHPVAQANLINQLFIRYVIDCEIHDHQLMFLGLHLNDLVGQHTGAVIQYVKYFQIFPASLGLCCITCCCLHQKLASLEHDNPVTTIIHHGVVELPATGNVFTKRVGLDTVSLRAVLAQAHRDPFKP